MLDQRRRFSLCMKLGLYPADCDFRFLETYLRIQRKPNKLLVHIRDG